MNQKLVALCLFLLFISFAHSETVTSTFIVKGLVVDSVSNTSLPYATVSVSDAEESTICLKRIASGVQGDFELTLNKAGHYLLSFESTGMKKLVKSIFVDADKKKVDLGRINLLSNDKELGGVTVMANKPLVKVDLDKISYDIKSDPESKTTTVLDMLKKVPLVTVDGEDKIQLKSSPNFKIYMNGKPSNMVLNNPSQVLKSMPASSIKSIEVITEPGAKYDAEGLGGIINIVTDHSLNGLTGNVQGGVDSKGGYYGGLNLSTKIGKFGLTTNLNSGDYHYPDSKLTSKTENFNAVSTKYINQSQSSDFNYNSIHANIEASYEFDSLNLVSLSVNNYVRGYKSTSNGQSEMMNANLDTLSAYKMFNKSKIDWEGGVDLSLDYQRTFKKPDQLFTLSYRLSHMPNNGDYTTEITGITKYPSSNQHLKSNKQGNEHTFQVDYTEPFNKKHVVELGAKYILRLNNSKNTYLQQDETTLVWEPMINRPKNDLDQTQNILAAYGSYTLKLEKFSVRTGLRYEQTESNVILTNTSFLVNFQNLVPSVTMSYKFNDASNLRLSYNQRISRPDIWYLNPFLDNSNPRSVLQGNPDLKPETYNSFSLNYSYVTPKFNCNADLYTSFINNSIESVRSLLNDTVQYSTYKNIGLSQYTGLSLYGNWQPTPKVRFYTNTSIEYTSMSTNDGSGLKNSGFNYSVSGGGQFTLPWEIKLGMNGGYNSSWISLQGRYSDHYYYGASVSRDFLSKKLSISMYVQNPFEKTVTYTNYTQTTDFRTDNISTRLARSFALSVSYRFGEMKEQIKKAQRGITNDDVKGGGGQGGGQ